MGFTSTYQQDKHIKPHNSADICLFLAYLSDLKLTKGISYYRIFKDCNIYPSFRNELKRRLKGEAYRNKPIHLYVILHIAMYYNFPFDSSKYWHLLELPERDKDIKL
jgi:hypothetical protein